MIAKYENKKPVRICDKVFIPDSKGIIRERPKSVYTNSPSPYEIADELYNRRLSKQCYAK